ncbi:DUF6578 domain-containing protein [Streptomyces sp. NPDC015139]|uniref:DUF6578 domain-containing protein n=1 Tax=Streptomyces sp. NPDC015139 TaxID=3364942 RepID=UPI0036F7B875
MPRMRVFYEDWQMECCGTPFAVGDEVAWRLVPYGRRDRRRNAGHGAEAWVENHGGPDRATTGRVHAIELVHQEFLARHDPLAVDHPEPEPGTLVLRPAGRRLEEVPDGRTLEPVDACPTWFEEDEEPPPRQVPYRVRRTVGALVTLDATGSVDLPRPAPDATPVEPGDRP